MTKFMLSSFVIVFTICFFNTGATFAQDEMEDVVYFEDGAVVRGKILELNTTRVIIEIKGGHKIERSFKEVRTISEEKVKIEVPYVNKTKSKKNVNAKVAYLVDKIKSIASEHKLDAAHAQENYQTEISADWSIYEDDSDREGKTYNLKAEIHFTEVDTVDHPFAEAAFLERIGSIRVSAGKYEYKNSATIKADGHIYAVGANFMKPDLPITIKTEFMKGKLEFDAPLDGNNTINYYNFGIGYFFTRSLLVGVEYSYKEQDIEIPIILVNKTYKRDNYKLAVKFVRELRNGTAFNIEGSFGVSQLDDGTDDESNTIIEILGDYYFNQKISIGGGLERNAGNHNGYEGITFKIDTKAFLTSIFSINFEFEKSADEESLQFILLARF